MITRPFQDKNNMDGERINLYEITPSSVSHPLAIHNIRTMECRRGVEELLNTTCLPEMHEACDIDYTKHTTISYEKLMVQFACNHIVDFIIQ